MRSLKSISLLFICLFFSLCLSIQNSWASDLQFSALDGSKISITFPVDWKVVRDGFQIRAFPSDDTIYLGVMAVPKGVKENNISDLLVTAIEDMVTDVTSLSKDFNQIEVNGINFNHSNAIGKDKDNGNELRVSFGYFSPKNDNAHWVAVIYFGTEEAKKIHKEKLQEIINSIRSPNLLSAKL
jgi:hypothetical protein